MRKNILFFLVILTPFLTSAQELFRSGRFLHHSTGQNIWGPNGSQTSIPLQMEIYNTSHGYTGTNAVTMSKWWWPSGGDNEWEYWHRIFDDEVPGVSITPILNSNKIVVIKSCYPSSEMVGWGQPSDTLTPTLKTNYNHKWHWRSIVNVMAQRPQNFFVIWTNAPHVAGNTNANAAGLAKQFCEWAKDTLAVGLDPVMGSFPPNIYVFDYFSKLTDENGFQMLQYAVSNTDSHPNALATELVAPQFVTEIFDAAIAYEQVGAILSVSPQNQNVTAAAGSTNFNVATTLAWTAQSNAGWCTVTPSGSGNGTLTASFSENTSITSRTATITISASGAPDQTVSVIQAGAAATLSVSPQSQNVGAALGSVNFSVASNTSWTAQSNTGWCTVTPSGSGNGTLTASFSENTSTTPRTATITISASGAPDQTASVIQAGAAATLSVSPQSQNVGAAQGNANFSIVSNTSWTAQSNAGWCTVTPSGNGNGTLTASFSENTTTTSRTATITISATGAPDQTASVIQEGSAATLSVSPQSQNVGAAQGSANFSVASNTDWTAQSNADWCTVTPSGSGNGTLTASFFENTTTTSRTATITISATGAPDQSVSVIQAGAAATLSVSPASQTVNSPAGSTGFNVVSNSQWNAVSDSEWCTVTSAGSGNGNLSADYDENTGTASRTAIITISATGTGNQTVNLVQFGSDAALAVSPDYQNVGYEAGETFFDIISNTSWTATSNELWCTVTPYGNGNFEITATYEANEEVYPRSANITISAAGVSDHVVTVIQSGIEATLSVSPTSQTVPSSEGEAVFSLLSNSMWNVSSDVEWCLPISDSGSGNGEIVTYYEPNETEYYRTAILTISAFGTDDVFVSLVQEGLLTGIDPKQQNKSFKIFPNPTTGQFMVEVPEHLSGETEIEVLDAQGKKTAFILRNKTLSTFNIDLSAASPGIYFVLLRNGSVELKQKLVLRR
jgi:5,10-methylene-tetrahydrofolate dehydrogenase/methenyl tetrahydrofolate cyclohydrolase